MYVSQSSYKWQIKNWFLEINAHQKYLLRYMFKYSEESLTKTYKSPKIKQVSVFIYKRTREFIV